MEYSEREAEPSISRYHRKEATRGGVQKRRIRVSFGTITDNDQESEGRTMSIHAYNQVLKSEMRDASVRAEVNDHGPPDKRI